MKVLVAEDHPIFRAGLKEILSKEPDVKTIAEAEDGQKALTLARKQRWDLMLLDITMPGKDGLQVLQELRRERPKLPVVVLSAHPEDLLAVRFLKSGAAGYVSKDKAPEVLLSAIRKVMRGEKYISQSLAEKTALALISETPRPPHETLSDREYQVMRMIVSGKTIQEIGKALFLSSRTVSTYRARVLAKMNMRNNTELLRYAFQHKLID